MTNNRAMKANTLAAMVGLLNQLDSKVHLLNALDADVTAEDCMDLMDQCTSMQRTAERLRAAVERANAVNGVDAEYEAMFGELCTDCAN